jgi:hypothetical protein
MVLTQLTKRAVRSLWGGREHVADLDLVVGDDHAVDEQFGQQPPLLEGNGSQAVPDGLAECLDAVGDGLQFQPVPGGGVQLPLLGKQSGVPAVQILAFALEAGLRKMPRTLATVQRGLPVGVTTPRPASRAVS